MLPHIIRCGGPKGHRKPVNLLNPVAAQFAALGNRFVPGDVFTFTRTTTAEGSDQAYSLPFNNARQIQFVLDGATGGRDSQGKGSYGGGKSGARATATLDVANARGSYLISGVLIYLGGRGENAGSHDGGGAGGSGGANGGAAGWGSGGPGGGGRTDIRRSSDPLSELLVAGGGGTFNGNVGNSNSGNGVRVKGSAGPSGETGGDPSYYFDTGGGGGGYYGGGTEAADDPALGMGGTSWADPFCMVNVSLPVGGAAAATAIAVVTILS